MFQKNQVLAMLINIIRKLSLTNVINALIASILWSILLSWNHAFANFGESCVNLPGTSGDNYLRLNTAYGHLIDNIDMKSYVPDSCNPNNNKIKFCLKNPPGSSPICKLVELTEGDRTTLGLLSANNPNLGGNKILQNIPLVVKRLENNICLYMETSRGSMPVACKNTVTAAPAKSVAELPSCSIVGQSCHDGHSKSQSIFNFSGTAVQCLKETLDKVFFQPTNCVPDAAHPIDIQTLVPFAEFQEALKSAIRAAFILYFMFYGIKVVLNHENAQLNHVATFLFKFIFVAYFAVGIGPIFVNSEGKFSTHNGMVEIGLPFLSQLTSDMAQIVFSAGGSKGLCEFDQTKYQHGYEFFAVWDAIDCRIGHYTGLRLMQNIGSILPNARDAPSGSIAQLTGSLPFFAVLFGFFMAGNIIVFVAGLAFAVVFISILLHFITSYLVCLVTLYLMAYISPIFIPMVLFERTKGYFDSWFKITLSCALQPAILAGFVALLLTMYDTSIYKQCQFVKHDYEVSGLNFSTFEIKPPDGDPESCTSSFGYKIRDYYAGLGGEDRVLRYFTVHIINDVTDLFGDFLYVFVFTIIFYFFSKQMSQFASEITSGPNMSAVVASPTKVVNAVMNAAKAAQDLANSMKEGKKPKLDGGDEGKGGGSDSKSGGGNEGGAESAGAGGAEAGGKS